MLDNSFRHRDNVGNNTQVRAGSAQRYRAESGIVHAEMPGEGDLSHGLQLCINLPRLLKNIAPYYEQIDCLPVTRDKGIIITTAVGVIFMYMNSISPKGPLIFVQQLRKILFG